MSLTPNPRALLASTPSALAGLGMIGVAVSLYALTLQTSLEIPRALVSDGIGRSIVSLLGGRFEPGLSGAAASARVSYGVVWLVLAGASLATWFAGAAWMARRRRVSMGAALGMWGVYGWVGWLPAGLWVVGQIAAETLGWTALGQFLTASCQLWNASLIAAWGAAFFTLSRRAEALNTVPPLAAAASLRVPWGVWVGIAVYVLCFGAMNTQLYRALLVPHGDSAMYEEHLWNLLHGKGFRSYLDQGLFLGEHIQVVHLGLIPLYVVWPSEILMEWCQSIALALGALPVYRIAARRCGSRAAGMGLALAYLLYFPMQRLDISIDFKTFRPEAFGIPLFLCALDALEARRWGWLLGWLAATLTVKEDYGLMIAALGVWMLCDAWRQAPAPERGWQGWLGAGLAAFGVVYVLLAVKVLIPYFRAGHPVHYTKYFGKFGNSVSEIALNLLSHPALAMQELLSAENIVFAIALLAPLGFLPLLAPGRLAVGLPLFGLLCLNEIARNPQHHFHAPLVPVLFWAAAAGLARLPSLWNALRERMGRAPYDAGGVLRFGCAWAVLSAAAAGMFLSASPLGMEFWDPSSGAHWSKKYVPGKRAEYAAVVVGEVPRDSRVDSTDFIHTRFTHYARSYDYSSYRPDVPEDADYLVVDVHAPYSTIHSPEDVGEYHEHPDRWELLPDRTDGYFYVFRRRR